MGDMHRAAAALSELRWSAPGPASDLRARPRDPDDVDLLAMRRRVDHNRRGRSRAVTRLARPGRVAAVGGSVLLGMLGRTRTPHHCPPPARRRYASGSVRGRRTSADRRYVAVIALVVVALLALGVGGFILGSNDLHAHDQLRQEQQSTAGMRAALSRANRQAAIASREARSAEATLRRLQSTLDAAEAAATSDAAEISDLKAELATVEEREASATGQSLTAVESEAGIKLGQDLGVYPNTSSVTPSQRSKACATTVTRCG